MILHMMQVTVPYGSYEKKYKLSPFTGEYKVHGKKKLQGLVISLLESERKEEIVLSQMINKIKKKTKHIMQYYAQRNY